MEVCGLLTEVTSLIAEHGLQALGLQWLQHVASVVVVHVVSIAALRHVGSSWTRDRI